MPTGYAVLKLLHLVAVVLFLGNVTFGLFWVQHAERERDAKLIAHAMRGVIQASTTIASSIAIARCSLRPGSRPGRNSSTGGGRSLGVPWKSL